MANGGVSARSAASGNERPLTGNRDPVYLNDTITTDAAGRARIELLDNTVFTVGPAASLLVDEFVYDPSTHLGSMAVAVLQGVFRFVTGKIGKAKPENMKVKLPLATIGIFGTDVLGEVEPDRNTVVLKYGKISIENKSGRAVIDRPDWVTVILRGEAPTPPAAAPRATLDGMNRALDIAAASPAEKERGDFEFKKDARTEVALGLSKDAVQAAAAVEARRAEYQEGKVMIDVFGKVVRLEEYILRPAADQFKFVVLNDRAGSFNYFYYLAQFNQALPATLAPALRYLNGKTGAAPDYFITAFETGRSNTIDGIQENGTGGHLINSPLAANTVVYDGGTNSFNTVAAGTPFWSTLFNNYSYKINGNEKFGWQPAGGNVTAYDYSASGINTRILGGGPACGAGGCATAGPVTCTSLTCENAARPSTITNPDGASNLHQQVTINYAGNGTAETYDFYVVGDKGNLATAADFNGVTSGPGYKNTLLKFNFEQTISASEFGGRKIDLVVEPKILVNSGVIQ